MLIQRFLRPRCVRWRKAMRCARPRESSKWTRTRSCAWLHRVACHCRTVMLSFWHDLHVSECQRDELWSFVHTKEAHLPGAKLYCETYGDAWVWIAFAPVWRLVLAFVIGKRDQAGADLLLARVAHVTDDAIPLFTSDQLPAYRHALRSEEHTSELQSLAYLVCRLLLEKKKISVAT